VWFIFNTYNLQAISLHVSIFMLQTWPIPLHWFATLNPHFAPFDIVMFLYCYIHLRAENPKMYMYLQLLKLLQFQQVIQGIDWDSIVLGTTFFLIADDLNYYTICKRTMALSFTSILNILKRIYFTSLCASFLTLILIYKDTKFLLHIIHLINCVVCCIALCTWYFGCHIKKRLVCFRHGLLTYNRYFLFVSRDRPIYFLYLKLTLQYFLTFAPCFAKDS
jgi:hypothetical protein